MFLQCKGRLFCCSYFGNMSYSHIFILHILGNVVFLEAIWFLSFVLLVRRSKTLNRIIRPILCSIWTVHYSRMEQSPLTRKAAFSPTAVDIRILSPLIDFASFVLFIALSQSPPAPIVSISPFLNSKCDISLTGIGWGLIWQNAPLIAHFGSLAFFLMHHTIQVAPDG